MAEKPEAAAPAVAAPAPTPSAPPSAAAAPVPAAPAETPAVVASAPVSPPVVPEAAAAPVPAAAVSDAAPAVAPAAVDAATETKPADKTGDQDSVLSAAAEPLKADAKPEDKPVEAKPAEPPAPLKYEALKFPDGAQLKEGELEGYTSIFGKHQIPEPVVQELIDHHAKQMQIAAQNAIQQQRETFNTVRRTWVESFKTDPDIGGNRRETVLRQAGGLIERYGGTADQQKELRSILTFTGAGDHPAVIRLLANAGSALGEGKIVPATRAKGAPTKSTPKNRYASTTPGA